MSRFWSFAQLSDKYSKLKPMDQVPDMDSLFIGGLKALDRPDNLEEAGITHILSVLEFDPCDYEEFSRYTKLLIQVEDHPGENLLKHFANTNSFLDSALTGGGVILVHCAMGVSRSATVVCAYLMYKHKFSPQEALERLRSVRPLCTPNDRFMDQLEVYERMLKATSDDEVGRLYSEWAQKQQNGFKI